MKIQDRGVGKDTPPFIVAEMSGNHNHSLERAFEIIDAAAKSGAHAIKLQTYTADTMTLDLTEGEFSIRDEKSLWKSRSLYDLYKEAHTPWEWHGPLFEHCRKRNLICFSSPFDETAVDFLENLGVPCYKIASFENTDLPLIQKAAKTGKPLIISTGMASIAELEESITAAKNAGCKDLLLLKCTSAYPAPPESANLLSIPDMRERFQCEIGLSDHTMGLAVPLASVALGASFIEKHFTLRRSDGGVDSAFSLEPEELKLLVVESERAWKALGKVQYGATEVEKPSLQFRRSLYVTQNMKAGETFTKDNVRAIRPGLGLAPKHIHEVLGRRAQKDLKKGTPVGWDLLGD